MTDKDILKLEWTDYYKTWGPMLDCMRSESLLLDLTIFTNDKKMLQAHKVVMAACSEFFRDILSTIPSGNYILVLKDVSACLLTKLLDFMYKGEVKVEQDILAHFLKLGEDLKVTGLCDKLQDMNTLIEDNDQEKSKTKLIDQLEEDWSDTVSITDMCSVVKDEKSDITSVDIDENETTNQDNCVKLYSPKVNKSREVCNLVDDDKKETSGKQDRDDNLLTKVRKSKKLRSFKELNDDSINIDEITVDLNETLEILKSIENLKIIDEESAELEIFVEFLSKLILKTTCREGGVIYFCAVCQKSLKMKQHIINHIEANHVKGVVHKCKHCGAKMKTRSSLVVHRNKTHRNQENQ